MGKGRPSQERQKLIHMAFERAYDDLRAKNKKSFPSFRKITEKANGYDFIVNSVEGKIGDKTLESSKSSDISILRERIKSEKSDFTNLAEQMPTELSIRNEELQSSLESNVLLAQEIERLENTIENKNRTIAQNNKHIEDLENEIRRLRKQISDMMAESLGQ